MASSSESEAGLSTSNASSSSFEEIREAFQRYVIPNYNRYPVCLTRGEGSRVWDSEGNEYLDFFPGWGCGLLGHCPPRIVQAVQEQVAQLIHIPNTWYIESQAELAKALSERTDFGGQCFFCNSGTEANEAAIKLGRLYGHATAEGGNARYKILSATHSFHGRTMGALSATGQPKYHEGVGPMLPGFGYAPFGDLSAMAEKVDSSTVAILVEPIQGEGGINIPPDGYLEGLRELCDQHQLLLIFDEVQSGMGRTGRWYAHQHWGVTPDIVTLAKALGGGVACGGLIARPEVAQYLKPGTHAATFGGNPIACRAALATIETIEQDNLLARAEAIGERIRTRFEALMPRCPLLDEVRVKGAMIGIQLVSDGTPILQKCMERRLLINCTQGRVLRFLPALTISDDEIDHGCDILEEVLLSHQVG